MLFFYGEVLLPVCDNLDGLTARGALAEAGEGMAAGSYIFLWLTTTARRIITMIRIP
jgi:hypothetical protein